MNTLIIFSALLVSSHLVLASKKPDINALLFYSQQTTNNCKTAGLQCKDCQTIQYCSASNLDSLFEIRCEDQSRLRPYCDTETNTCVKEIPAVCDLPESTFHCPGTGYYPDLEDCANYYICDEDKVATRMACPAGSNWVQGTQSCTAGIYCRSYSPKLGQCKGKTNKLVAYAPDKNMYVLCLSNGPILFQCPNKWEVFDDAEVTCKFECTQNGFFPHPTEPTKFYSCTKVGKGYESVVLECPEGYDFAELSAGQGICTLRTTTTTTTTQATTIILDLTTILEESTTTEEENNNDDEQIVEEEHHSEDLGEQHEEIAENNEEEHHQTEEIVEEEHNNEEEQIVEHHSEEQIEEHHSEEQIEEHHSEEHHSEEQIEEHHSEEIASQNNEETNLENKENSADSDDQHLVDETPEESASKNEAINSIIEEFHDIFEEINED